MNDHERLQQLNVVEVWASKLATTPNGVVTMRQRMLDAVAGVKGQSYDVDNRQDRYEDVLMPNSVGKQIPFRVKVPSNDPTGEAAITPDEARVALDELDRLLALAHRTMLALAGYHDVWCPPLGAKKPTEDGPGPDWCENCFKDNKHLWPVDGRYKGLCRRCGDFRGAEGYLPPLPILRLMHQGKRVTASVVARYARQSNRKAS